MNIQCSNCCKQSPFLSAEKFVQHRQTSSDCCNITRYSTSAKHSINLQTNMIPGHQRFHSSFHGPVYDLYAHHQVNTSLITVIKTFIRNLSNTCMQTQNNAFLCIYQAKKHTCSAFSAAIYDTYASIDQGRRLAKNTDSGGSQYKFQTCSSVQVYMRWRHISCQAGPIWAFPPDYTGCFKELDKVTER